ncbi:hypothetical protein B484DRAFT_210645 [Ochromonadaceae sp. CCMP2298]|nr:hypothetical protein B484DRAFT_210645 [Ochromonadaceae sp. CCMP2298]
MIDTSSTLQYPPSPPLPAAAANSLALSNTPSSSPRPDRSATRGFVGRDSEARKGGSRVPVLLEVVRPGGAGVESVWGVSPPLSPPLSTLSPLLLSPPPAPPPPPPPPPPLSPPLSLSSLLSLSLSLPPALDSTLCTCASHLCLTEWNEKYRGE